MPPRAHSARQPGISGTGEGRGSRGTCGACAATPCGPWVSTPRRSANETPTDTIQSRISRRETKQTRQNPTPTPGPCDRALWPAHMSTHHFILESSTPTFILKLHALVSDASYSDAITWSPDGSCVVIPDTDVFTQRVLGRANSVFKTSNYTSFVRQLNMYGFNKVNGYKHFGRKHPNIFRHAHFQRDHPDLLARIRRMPQKPRTMSGSSQPGPSGLPPGLSTPGGPMATSKPLLAPMYPTAPGIMVPTGHPAGVYSWPPPNLPAPYGPGPPTYQQFIAQPQSAPAALGTVPSELLEGRPYSGQSLGIPPLAHSPQTPPSRTTSPGLAPYPPSTPSMQAEVPQPPAAFGFTSPHLTSQPGPPPQTPQSHQHPYSPIVPFPPGQRPPPTEIPLGPMHTPITPQEQTWGAPGMVMGHYALEAPMQTNYPPMMLQPPQLAEYSSDKPAWKSQEELGRALNMGPALAYDPPTKRPAIADPLGATSPQGYPGHGFSSSPATMPHLRPMSLSPGRPTSETSPRQGSEKEKAETRDDAGSQAGSEAHTMLLFDQQGGSHRIWRTFDE